MIRGYPQKLNVHIDDSKMMTNILSKLFEEYQTIVEILEEKLDDKENSSENRVIRLPPVCEPHDI